MASVALRLCRPRPATADLALQAGDPCIPRLPGLTAELHLLTANTAALDSAAPAISGDIDASYDNAVWRGVARETGSAWQIADPGQTDHPASWRRPIRRAAGIEQPHMEALRLSRQIIPAWEEMDRRRLALAQAWQPALGRYAASASPWLDMRRLRPVQGAAWRAGLPRLTSWRGGWIDLHRLRPLHAANWQLAADATRSFWGGWHPGIGHLIGWDALLNGGGDRWGWGGVDPIVPDPEPPDTRCYRPVPGLAPLAFSMQIMADRLALVFLCQAKVSIPILRTYIVANDVTLRRMADNHVLDALSLSLSIDADSWVWGFSASLPGSDLDEVVGNPGEPVELEATVNGYAFRLLAERVARSREFGRARVTLSGRGIAAVLDAPYAPVLSLSSAGAITAQQAATAAIQHVSLPLGWSLDWRITDWLLPAGAWTHQGSPISAVQRIATAAGAYIQADADSQTLMVLPRYPIAPWDWPAATADIEVPAAVCTTEAIEWADKPAYNAVYVSGSLLARVKRAGSAGDILAQMITDDLTTHTDAARQRGLAILADAGRQARQTITLPILVAGGILMPGQLAQFTDGAVTRRGLVRGVSISTGVRVRQTVEIETHE